MTNLVLLPEGMIDLFRLYTFIDKLNTPILHLIQKREQSGGDVYTLSMTDNVTVFLTRRDNHYSLNVSGVVGIKPINLTVKLGKKNYPIDKRVVNEIKSKLFKYFNGVSPELYIDTLWQAIENNLIIKFKKFEKEFNHCLFSKTLKDTVNLHNSYGVMLNINCTNIKKYKIIPSGVEFTLNIIVFGMAIATASFSLHGNKDAVHHAFDKQLCQMKSVIL